ncbi:MAG: cupredoxin domain-containing protein [Gemmatimonadota bacterium]
MKTGLRRIGMLLAAVAAVALAACRLSDGVSAPAPGTVLVEMKDNFFSPDTVTVTSGLTVRWTNHGANVHTVTLDTVSVASEFLAPKWWFEARFDNPGTFAYHCSRHPEMIGTIVVQ